MRENIYVENFIYKAAARAVLPRHPGRGTDALYTLEQRVASLFAGGVPAAGDRYHSSYPGAAGPGHRQCPGGGDPYLKKLSAAETVELFRGGVRIRDRKGLERLVEQGGL